MRFKAVASAIALVTALGLGGAANAQTVVNGLNISDVDLPRVQEYCNQLQAGMTPDATPSGSPDSPTSTDAVGTEPNDDEEGDSTDDNSDDNDSTLELGDITLEGCQEAGLITQ